MPRSLMVDLKKPKRNWPVLLSTQLIVAALWSGVCGALWRWEPSRPQTGGILPGDWSHVLSDIAMGLFGAEIVFTTLCIVVFRWFRGAPQVLALHSVLIVISAAIASVSF